MSRCDRAKRSAAFRRWPRGAILADLLCSRWVKPDCLTRRRDPFVWRNHQCREQGRRPRISSPARPSSLVAESSRPRRPPVHNAPHRCSSASAQSQGRGPCARRAGCVPCRCQRYASPSALQCISDSFQPGRSLSHSTAPTMPAFSMQAISLSASSGRFIRSQRPDALQARNETE